MGKVVIVAIAKNEERYITDWSLYHFNLGFDRIYVIDNNDLDSDGQLKVITGLQKKGYNIFPMDARGREKLEQLGFQTGAYLRTYRYIKKNHEDVEWVAFIDIDEYFDFDGLSVKEFLGQAKFRDADSIHVNWKLYGDNDQLYYEPRPVIERFTKPAPLDVLYNTRSVGKGFYHNQHVKSIVRITDKEFRFRTPHTVVFKENSKCVDVDGGIVDGRSPFQTVNWNGGHLKHFITKSTEEFFERKLKSNPRADTKIVHSVFNEELESYFNINTKTHSKMCLIERLLAECQTT